MIIIREDTMAEQNLPPRTDPYQVTRIVTNYVRHHKVDTGELAGLIAGVHRALASLGRDTPPVQEPPRPAVPIRRSVERDHVVCLECGYRAQMLRRHLRIAHGLEAAAYRIRWKLPMDHPLTAPSYSARRSTMAKEIGLGRRAAVEPGLPATVHEPAITRQGSAIAASRPVTRRGGRKPRLTPAP
jgi:predicted transcriptional regulator